MNNRFDEAINEVEAEIQTTREAAPRPAPAARPKRTEKVVSMPKQNAPYDSLISAELAADLNRAVLPMTIRFRPQIATAMKRIVLENRLRGQKPDSIQDAMNEAAAAWITAKQT